jgi:hypothetical protein
MRVVRCGLRELAQLALASTSCSPVVAIVDDDRAATEALGTGVDEVVRQSELTAEGIDRVVNRAQARARGRLRALEAVRPPATESDALSVLLEWIAIELAGCVSGAVLDGELLESGVRNLLDSHGAASAVMAHGATAGPDAAGLTSDDLLEMLETVQASTRRTLEVLNALRGLSNMGAPGAVIPRVLEALACVLRSQSIPFADIRVEINGPCETSVPTSKLVAALVVAVSSAFDRAARASRNDGTRAVITLRAFAEEGASFVEIEDDVDETAHRDGAIGRRADAITQIGATLRELGGDLLVESGGGYTTTRLVLPSGAESAVPVAASDSRPAIVAARQSN